MCRSLGIDILLGDDGLKATILGGGVVSPVGRRRCRSLLAGSDGARENLCECIEDEIRACIADHIQILEFSDLKFQISNLRFQISDVSDLKVTSLKSEI